ncbi:hypothetical protein [Solemya velum gill symbiont]|uniref:hypothetical protein n=1 Tax=Solemya velum gill symbiont TaxID=2340 RepID=UPI001E33E5DA|nr:hypothetical protein [Solemya velum gill symbiont]
MWKPNGRRRTKLLLDYATKMTAYPFNSAYDCVFHAQHKNLYEQYQRFISSFEVRTIPHFEAAEIPSTYILPNKPSNKPPWSLKIPSILYTTHNKSESTTHPLALQLLFAEIRHNYSNHQPIYTDGSENQEKVSAAMYAPPSVDTVRPPNNSSIFSAELYALLLALQRIQSHKSSKFIVFTDSLPSLHSLSSFKITHPLVLQLLEFYNVLLQKSETTVFCGNKKVDSIARTAWNSDMSSFKVPYSDFKPFSTKYKNCFWQLEWDTLVINYIEYSPL